MGDGVAEPPPRRRQSQRRLQPIELVRRSSQPLDDFVDRASPQPLDLCSRPLLTAVRIEMAVDPVLGEPCKMCEDFVRGPVRTRRHHPPEVAAVERKADQSFDRLQIRRQMRIVRAHPSPRTSSHSARPSDPARGFSNRTNDAARSRLGSGSPDPHHQHPHRSGRSRVARRPRFGTTAHDRSGLPDRGVPALIDAALGPA